MSLPELLGKDYWVVRSRPLDGVTAEDIAPHVADHLTWLLGLEDQGSLFLSGPLLEGPGVSPGAGITVLRADDADAARRVADQDPFVLVGLRTFEIFRWRVNEGAVRVSLALGEGTFTWD